MTSSRSGGPTAGDLIDEVIALLQSWSLDSEQSTTLAADMGQDDLGLTVTAARGVATGMSAGIVEIGQELMYVDSVSAQGVATMPPWGRGYLGTTATAHPGGSRVVSQPTFPRSKVLDALNETMARVYPMVYAIKQVELTTKAVKVTYDLPPDAQWVIDARWQTASASHEWRGVKRWRMSSGGGSLEGDTNVSIDIGDAMQPGRPIQIKYAGRPTPLASEDDEFALTGLNTGLRDVVCLGAASNMTTSQELSRLQMSSMEQQNRSQLVAPSAALTSSRFLEQRFQQRLMEERRTLQRLYPPRMTGGWI